ncbi:hypothetical protein NECAME_03635 [Necator americanus]|uniref:PAN domain protein n=1 Tax=Necator americanus TaxID=51031 RepID=W2T4H9_NECAM|nr:hypothetical protein NECAME_03635 [Necator americanus]ETN75862.1 hypothetical protein NECAME_03635 [Necator americanus]
MLHSKNNKQFYHLDTCICPLDDNLALWYPNAFHPISQFNISNYLELLPVTESEAQQFACNAVVIGKDVIMNEGSERIAKVLQSRGFRAHFLPMSEYLKSGGSSKCLTLRLDYDWLQSIGAPIFMNVIFQKNRLLGVGECSEIGDVSPFGECFGSYKPVFMRISGSFQDERGLKMKASMPACASNCRRNLNPFTDTPFPCRGFNFRPGKNPECQLFRVPPRCAESAFVFDVKRGYTLRSTSESRQAYSAEQCADICIAEQCGAFAWDDINGKCGFFNSSRRYDLYRNDSITFFENNCLNSESRCPDGRVEFFMVKRADVPSFGVSVGARTLRNCMKECVDTTLFKCKSSQFESVTGECFVSDEASDVAVSSTSLDMYEPYCSTVAKETTNCIRLYSYEKLITSRLTETANIREMKNTSVETCLSECTASKHRCRSVNYDVSKKSCYLLSKSRFDGVIPVGDDMYDYYEQACLEKENGTIDDFMLMEVNRTLRQEFLLTTSKPKSLEPFPTLVHDSALRQAFAGEEATIFDLNSSLFVEDNGIKEGKDPAAATTVSTKLEGSSTGFSPNHLARDKSVGVKKEMYSGSRESLGPNTSEYDLKNNILTADPELQQLSDYESIPRLALPSERIGFVEPEKVKVRAECHETGMNVSFNLDGKHEQYTGAVYAAERFEQCRIFLRSSKQFAIFIPRPQHNTWCNALEIDKVMSVVIVMSNDRVLPHDVTTKDDLFFHVTCNYSTPMINKIRQGIVVGGPSPVAITSKELNRHIFLQIMKKGRPVDSVFIGEALVARVESDISPERLRVMECTAHRVGGSGPPTSVTLLADGCALLPSLMAPMQMGKQGWESTLSAFRIDGSEQVDIVCLVAVCPDEGCPNVICPPTKDRRSRSLAEKHPIRVDHRLIVKARAADSFQKDSRTFPEVCLQPTVYLSGLGLLALSLAALAVSLCVGAKRRSDSVEDLLSISQWVSCFVLLVLMTILQLVRVSTQQKDVGAKYIKTLSL